MRVTALAALITIASGCQGDNMQAQGFFEKFKPSELGVTHLVRVADNVGSRGAYVKFLDLQVEPTEAALINIVIRSEYSINEPTSSPMPRAAVAITNATNAAPIVITSAVQHELLTGAKVTINAVTGNNAANGAFTITVISPTTFSLDTTVGSGAYTGGGTYVAVTTSSETGAVQVGGPLVAKVTWGIGAAQHSVEFDVPSPRQPGLMAPLNVPQSWPVNDIGNGVSVSVYASVVEVEVRNDGNLRTVINAQKGLPASTIGGPTPAKVLVFAAPGVSTRANVKRTIYLSDSNDNFLVGDTVPVTIPNNASRVWLLRVNAAAAIIQPNFTAIARDNLGFATHEYVIPVNDSGPFELFPGDDSIDFTNASASACGRVLAMFEVDPI